jgi:hypothetical protein
MFTSSSPTNLSPAKIRKLQSLQTSHDFLKPDSLNVSPNKQTKSMFQDVQADIR